MISDWRLYELALFNVLQNSLKYNSANYGDVVILQTCKVMEGKRAESGEYMFETQVIDSGIGISQERQEMLFTPFLELRNRIGIVKAENDNIGLGLSCSK